MVVKQKSFSERRAENEQRLKDVGGGVYASKPSLSSSSGGDRYIPVASSKGGGVIIQDQFTKQTNIVGDVESINTKTFEDGSTDKTTTYTNLRYANPFVSPERRGISMPSQDPYIPASQVDGNRFVIQRVAENQPKKDVLGTIVNSVTELGPSVSRLYEKRSGVNNDKLERSPAFILASQVARDTRYSQASRKPYSFEDVSSGFGETRPILEFLQFQRIKKEEQEGTPTFRASNPTRERFISEYQEQGSAFAQEYRRIKPNATDREVAEAYDLYYKRQLAKELGGQATLTGAVGASTETLARIGIQGYKTVKPLLPEAFETVEKVTGKLGLAKSLGIVKRPLTNTFSRAELSGLIATSTGIAGGIEGASSYYVQSSIAGQKTNAKDLLYSVGLGAVSAGSISTAQTRLATSSSRSLRTVAEPLFSAGVNIGDPSEALSDSAANFFAGTVGRSNARVRTFLTEPSLTQTNSRYPSFVFNSVQTRTSAFGSSPLSSTRTTEKSRTAINASPFASTNIFNRPSTRTTSRPNANTNTNPFASVYSRPSAQTNTNTRTNINIRVFTPDGLFSVPRMGGASRGISSLLGATKQRSQYATSLSSVYFRRSAGRGSFASLSGIGLR